MSGTAFIECPRFDGHRLSFAQLFDDAHGAMRTLVWHKDQKAVSALILAIHLYRGLDIKTDSSS